VLIEIYSLLSEILSLTFFVDILKEAVRVTSCLMWWRGQYVVSIPDPLLHFSRFERISLKTS
jgi:hypothetical protein